MLDDFDLLNLKTREEIVENVDYRLGSYFIELLQDHSWLPRRSETIELLGNSYIKRNISSDLIPSYVAKISNSNRISWSGEIPVIIGIFKAGLQLDLDISTSRGAVSAIDSSCIFPGVRGA